MPTRCGTVSGYTNGACRCQECRDAMARYKKKHRDQQAQLLREGRVSPQHGNENTYCNYGCRCPECTSAWKVACKRRSLSRRAA
jgi:hypothetical protein